jgi:hypothetical protein
MKDLAEEVKKEQEDKEVIEYTDEQKSYLSLLMVELEGTRTIYQSHHTEFNDKTYYQYHEDNEKIANTYIEPVKNTGDPIVASGTVETKLDALLSAINNLNLDEEVVAYDENDEKINTLGIALKDIIDLTEELDGEGGDEEKKMQRQRELHKQGTVFVQEDWVCKYETKKKLTKKYNGEFKNWDNWTEKLEKVFEGCQRTVLYGPSVYLGDITAYYMDAQPYIFTSEVVSYEEAKRIYQKFENWKYVKKGGLTLNEGMYNNKWRFFSKLKNEEVEIIKYQNAPRDEFQVIINGVLMMPIGYPLSAVSPGGKYNITKQIAKAINNQFAYGKGFVSYGGVKYLSALFDEMLRLVVLKTRKSFQPPYVNTTNRVISARVLSPGKISMGIPADALKAIGQEGTGVNAAEFNAIQFLSDGIDKNTISPTFMGQQGKGNATATEIMELQRQAKMVLGLMVLTTSLLEKKLGYARLFNILQNWFEPIGTTVDDARSVIKNKYRKSTRETNIEGEGKGERMVVPTDEEMPRPEMIREMEMSMEKQKGYPVRMMFLSAEDLKKAKLKWYIRIVPAPDKSSATEKLMFREYLADVMSLANFGSAPNVESLEEDLARNWNKSKSKVFSKIQPAMNPALMAGGSGQSNTRGRNNNPGAPQMPSGMGE